MNIDCTNASTLFWSALDDDLDEKQDCALAAHLAACEPCRAQFAATVQAHRRLCDHAVRPVTAMVQPLIIRRWWPRAALAALLLIGVGIAARMVTSDAMPTTSQVVDGAVVVQRDGQRLRLIAGDHLRSVEVIEADGDARLILTDGATAELSAGARLDLDAHGGRLANGALLVTTANAGRTPLRLSANQLGIMANTASYRLEASGGLARLAVLSGEVTCRDGAAQHQVVHAGQGAFSTSGTVTVDDLRRDQAKATAIWSFASRATPLRGSYAGQALDLFPESAGGPTWSALGIDLADGGRILSRARLPSDLIAACRAAGGCTIETWLRPAPGVARNARIITLRPFLHLRVQTIEDGADGPTVRYALRIGGGSDGPGDDVIGLISPPVPTPAQATHVLAGIGPDGLARLWIDGQLVKERSSEHRALPFTDDLSLTLGDKLDGGTPWFGRFRLLAIHPGLLSDEHAQRLFRLGGWLPPTAVLANRDVAAPDIGSP